MRAMHSERSSLRDAGEVSLREAEVADAEAVESVHYTSREAVYAGRTADWPPPGPDRAGRIARWREWLGDPAVSAVIAEVDGEIVGFCTIRPAVEDDSDPETAEMPTLYIRPDSWHRGIGRALCEAGLQRARDRGFRRLILWVLDMNGRARAFYETFGFEADGATKVDELTTERLVALRYRIDLADGQRA